MTAGLETFAKVRTLHDRTTNPGERAAAAVKMKALARKAGMTVAQAVSKLDAPPVTIVAHRTVDMSDFFNTPYFREQMAERERERLVRWRGVLGEYGTEEAVFDPGPMERAIDEAAALFGPHAGWDAYPLDKVPPEIVATVEAAWPIPVTVCSAWIEFAFWDKLGRDREARGSACGDPSPAVQIRCRILERMLDGRSALSLNDLRARLSWFEHRDEIDRSGEDRTRLATLRADIERMGARIREQDAAPVQDGRHGVAFHHPMDLRAGPAPVQSGQADGVQDRYPTLSPCRTSAETSAERGSHSEHPLRRTNADKRRDVLALLGSGLTDREIARRAGVSPTTVGTIRRTAP